MKYPPLNYKVIYLLIFNVKNYLKLKRCLSITQPYSNIVIL